jgi:hypothetical protein
MLTHSAAGNLLSFRLAFSTVSGVAGRGVEPLLIYRFSHIARGVALSRPGGCRFTTSPPSNQLKLKLMDI